TRKIRELGVYSELHSHRKTAAEIKEMNPKGIILSGGPHSISDADRYQLDEEIFQLNVPVLGICYGMQLMADHYGGKMERTDNREYGKAELQVKEQQSGLFNNTPTEQTVWMSYGDHVVEAPEGFQVDATSESIQIAAMSNPDQQLYGLAFHPEVSHSE